MRVGDVASALVSTGGGSGVTGGFGCVGVGGGGVCGVEVCGVGAGAGGVALFIITALFCISPARYEEIIIQSNGMSACAGVDIETTNPFPS